ncbi:MAG: hypothetical protein AB1444_00270 [Spirochaetota bacterium]
MPLATVTMFRELLGGASHLADARLQSVLNFAEVKVKNDGISDTHELFAQMQMYYAASILERSGEIDYVTISRQVGDVSTSYLTNQYGGFFNLYVKELRNIIGKSGFIV